MALLQLYEYKGTWENISQKLNAACFVPLMSPYGAAYAKAAFHQHDNYSAKAQA